ncbi:MAG: DUF1549 domain-containing protein [Planctomycetaceae bacterium]|nr:DUF1549 domain-containing protein [Planctomycetaceae bacterium]
MSSRITMPLFLLFVSGLAAPLGADEVSFRRDVMPILGKAGCNRGTCHGNANGKGDFKLTLRGDDPTTDFQTLSHDWLGRRTNRLEPEQSLLLQKATMQVPHLGGRRFEIGSPEYVLLRDWIAEGVNDRGATEAPLVGLTVTPESVRNSIDEPTADFEVTAKFGDGTTRIVTGLAVFEPVDPILELTGEGRVTATAPVESTLLVRYMDRQVAVPFLVVPNRPPVDLAASQAGNLIDREVLAKLESVRMEPSPLCDDSTFVRRVMLDLTGVKPTAEEARRFVASTDVDKRAKLIDQLLESQAFADWWALKWSDMLRVEEKTLDRKGVGNLHGWLRESFATNKPLDKLVHQLIAARGSTYSEPPANFYRALREPFERSEGVAQLFLGVRLQCAKCHNHPFDRWTQDDYYSWGNLFARVDYKIVSNNRRDSNDKHEFDGEQIVWMKPSGDVDDPRTGKPRKPRFLGAESAVANEADRLLALADWLTGPDNTRFAQVLVNRTWEQVFGRGLVDPVDDFRDSNPPSHPRLLEELSRELRESGYDVRHVLRLMLNSTTYQRASSVTETNQDDERNLARTVVRRLTAEQILDSYAAFYDRPLPVTGYPAGTRAGELAGVSPVRSREQKQGSVESLLRLFGRPPRLQSCDCERSDEPTLNQTFQLVSGNLLNELLTDPKNRLANWLESGMTTTELVDSISWEALSRAATPVERERFTAYLEGAKDRRQGLEDVCWAVLNSHEFLLRY